MVLWSRAKRGTWGISVLECDDIIAWFDGRDVLADRFDYAGTFVAKDDGEGALWVFAG